MPFQIKRDFRHSHTHMPEQFVVPQFIDAEDKIFGPITARQFIILMITGLLDFALFKLLSFVWFVIIGLLILSLGGILAFTRINGQPFHYFILNIIQTFKRPRLRIWEKYYPDSLLRVLMKEEVVSISVSRPKKAPLSSSRLNELTLVVNTGGVYQPEE